MKKDLVKTVRINSKIAKALEKQGWSVQKLLDDALQKKVKTKVSIQVEKFIEPRRTPKQS